MSSRSVSVLRAVLFAIAAISSAAMPVPACAKSVAELKKIETQLAAEKSHEGALQEVEKKTSASLQQLQQKLVHATRALQEKQAESEELTEKLQTLTTDTQRKEEKLKDSRTRLGGLMTALLELSREPPEALMLHTTLTKDQIHRAILLRELLPRVQAATNDIAAELADMERLKGALSEQQRLVAAAEQNLVWQKSNLDDLIKTRKGLLQKTEAERTAISKQLASLTSEAKDLRQLMQKVSQSIVIPKVIEKETKNLSLRKGLRMPVSGRVLHPYGGHDAYGVTSQGLTLIGAGGSPVVAPASGRVVFVGPFKGYGQIVILSHGNGYHSFLAGFGRIDAEMGQDITAGEPLGILPDSTARPEFYFEWRYHNEPIDPGS